MFMFNKLSLINKISLFLFYITFVGSVFILGYFIFNEQYNINDIFSYVSIFSFVVFVIGYLCHVQDIFKIFTKLNFVFSMTMAFSVGAILIISSINFFFKFDLFNPILGLFLSIHALSFFGALSTGQICFEDM